MLSEIILIGLLGLAYGYWCNAQKTKEIALEAATQHCFATDVQMLDGYVALTGMGLHRDKQGKLQLHRAFMFEFSPTGLERYQGLVLMLGRQIESIEMGVYRID
ncbi:MAG: DUF3301 domain-containing protein [Methylococcales bacterium]|nr:DUF3301 domain-containing protein [Methylococcales bacterium]